MNRHDAKFEATYIDSLRAQIAELERREALLTANVAACELRRSYNAPKPPIEMTPAELREWSLEDTAITHAVIDTYAALVAAGYPWLPVDGGDDGP